MFKNEDKKIFWSNLYMRVRKVLIYALLIILAFVCLFTMYVLIVNATRHTDAIKARFSAALGTHVVENFRLVFIKGDKLIGTELEGMAAADVLNTNIIKALGNTLLIAGLSTLLTVYFSCVTAYGIHMYQFKLRNAAFTFILVIMMIPSQVSAAGFVNLCYSNNWISQIFPLVLPGIAAPVTFFYIKQYMESVLPYEMVEAARVDGAGEIRIFHQIVLPVLKPAIAVQVIFSFVGSWNNYFMPKLILMDPNKATMPIVISKLYSASNGTIHYGMINAVIFIGVVPLIVVYFFFSRYIIKGLTLGAVKG